MLEFRIRVYLTRKKALRGGSTAKVARITAHIIGYARVSVNVQDLTANGFGAVGVPAEAHLVSLCKGGQHTTTEIAKLFKVARSTVYPAGVITDAGATELHDS